MTGLALPPLDVSALQFGGAWASANSLVFLDLMKHSTPFEAAARSTSSTGAWGWLNPASVTWRPDGYPAGLAPPDNRTRWSVATTIGAGGAYYPAGRYVVLYGGEGSLELDGDAAVPPLASTAGRLEVNVTPSAAGLRLRITSSSPANPVVNVRIVPAAFEANHTAQLFHPDFLEMLKGVRLLRFAAWMRATWNSGSGRAAPRDWAARTTPAHSSQVREADGVAVEHLVQLANSLNASMWVSLPRAANESDPYTYGMMHYIGSNLAPGLSCTVEYGIDGPGWLSSHLPTNTRLIAGVARRAWAAAGRPAGLLRVVQTAPLASVLGNLLDATNHNLSYVDAIAMPASFGGSSHWVWAGHDNPTGWATPEYSSGPRNTSLDNVVQLIRSSAIAADVAYNKQLQALRARGLPLLGYAAGAELLGPTYAARANYDRALRTCGGNVTWPCTVDILYSPWSYSGGPSSVTWPDRASFNATLYGPLAANASREAALESVLRRARGDGRLYDIALDSLWRWHGQMGGGDLVVDVARAATSCSAAPGAYAGLYSPDECRGTDEARALVVGKPTESPTYRALRAWIAAVEENGTAAPNPDAGPGALPRSAATAPPAVPPPAVNCSRACVYGSCVNGSCECWAGASGAACETLGGSGGGTPAACNSRLGVNLEGISDYSRSWTFVDVFKASRAWIPQGFSDSSWNTNAPISFVNTTSGPGGRTALGYPSVLATNQKVSTLVQRDLQGHTPAGWYTVLYDGKGLLDFSMSDVTEVVFVEAGHVRVRFKPSTDMNNGILVSIERTDPTDPLRNIRVLTPGYEAAAVWGGRPFHPALLAFLRPFGLLRFMDWMHTNNAGTPAEWEQRPLPEDRSYAVAPGGVPLEHMLLLANTLGADAWFNMPYAASDDYVAKFAAAVRDGLRPDLKAYVEYGNELWGTGFPGGQYAQSMGLAMNLTEEGNKWYGGATNEARLCFVAQRTANISRIWKAAWGAQAGRVVVVVSGQAVWPITSSKLLACRNASRDIDVLAIAPYFGSYNKSRDTNLTVFVNSTLPAQLNETLSLVKQHAAIAASFGKPLVTYEAGQGLTGDGSSTDLAIQANRDRGMAAVYSQYLAGLAAANVSRITHFSSLGAYTKYGSWGLMEAQDQDLRDAPKYQAVMSYINSTATCALPSPPAPSTCPGNGCSGNGACLPGGTCSCYSGYSGADCSVVAYTEVYNCGYRCTFDQGSCNVSTVSRTTRTWGCSCKPGIGGLACSIVSCPNNCSWNGECLDQGVCACFPGFSGADCSRDCGCGGHGRCDGNGGCVCDAGWRKGASGKCEWDCSGCAQGASCIGPGECGCAERCVYGTCFHGACSCWAGYGGPACNLTEAAAAAAGLDAVPRMNRGSLAGINLAGVSYYDAEWVWLDVMKGSSAWMTSFAPDTSLENAFDTGVPLELRPDGYPARLPPGVIVHKLLLRNLLLHAWPGRYVVLYDGDGRLDFQFDATVLSRGKGRMEIRFTPTADLACAATGAAYCGDNGISLRLTSTNPANPLRNIRILPSGDGTAASAGGKGAGGAWEGRADRVPFHPWFLKSVSRYRVIRFMTWMSANDADGWAAAAAVQGGAWAARTTPSHDTQAHYAQGVSLEHIVQLCNLLGADPWVTVHHLADDAYVAAMAALLRDSLRPDVKVYVEHSNEVWNGLFSQHAYARARGLALNLSTDPATAAYRYHALRTTQIGAAFRSAFASGPGEGAARVQVVLGGWGYLCNNGTGCGTTVMKETLGWNGTAAKVDFHGVTAYWDCGLGSNGASDVLLSVDQMLSRCNASLGGTEAAAKALVAAAAPYGVPLITYEAGPSVVEASAIASGSATAGLADKFVAVNRHARMYGLYQAYLEAFRRSGLVGEGRPWMQFVSTALPGKYGSWGLQEYTGQAASEAHKYRALMDWLDQQVNATAGSSGPRVRPTCMSLKAMGGAAAGVSGSAGGGGVMLSDGVLAGAPAVLLPAAGQVWVQGLTASVRLSTVGWSSASPPRLNITLWLDSDCSSSATDNVPSLQQQRPGSQAIATLSSGQALSPAGSLDWRVPLSAELPALATALASVANATGTGAQRVPRFFLRVTDGPTTNYSEPFDIRPPYDYIVGSWGPCNCNASTPQQERSVTCAAVTTTDSANSSTSQSAALLGSSPLMSPACDNFTDWNLTLPSLAGDPICTIESTGCRTYRTSNIGAWYFSVFKPVTDCTAQSSPWPVAAGGLSTSTTALPLVSLAVCADQTGIQAPATTQACPASACSGAPGSSGTSFCELPATASLLSLLNAGAAACNTSSSSSSSAGNGTAAEQQGCASTEVCTALATCSRWVCDASSQKLTQVSCSALCLPRVLSLTAAKVADDGRSINVTLTARASPLVAVPCSRVFDSATAQLLGGGGALCSTAAGDMALTIALPANATIVAGNALVVKSSGSALVSALNASQAYTGNVTLSSCSSCVAPVVYLSGSTNISTSTCDSAGGSLLAAASSRAPAVFDASLSVDPSGRTRWASARWSVMEAYGTAAGRAVLQGAVDRVNNYTAISDKLRVTLTTAEADALEEGVEYRLKVALTSWLGSSASAFATFTRSTGGAVPTPTVVIAGPPVQTVRVGSGLRLSADLVGGACRGYSLTWNWTSPSGWSALPTSGRAGQQLVLPGPLNTASGQNITLRVTATYTGAGGASASAYADVSIVLVGSTPFATLSGPNGDVPDNTTMVFNASASTDPDVAAGQRASLSYAWECRRDDYPTPCFSTSQHGTFSNDQGVWTVPAGLLSNDRWHTITVTVSKAANASMGGNATLPTSSASVTFRPRSAALAFPRGTLTRQCSAAECSAPHSTDRDLTVMLQLAAPYNTPASAGYVSVAWSSPEAPSVASLDTVSSANGVAFTLTVPAEDLPSDRSSITITANLAAQAVASGDSTALNGTAAVVIPLNSAPYCTLSASNASACLSLELRNATFPFAAAVVTASGWADSLRYEFGLLRSSSSGAGPGSGTAHMQQRVQQLGTASSATLVGLPQGTVQLYGCAIDAAGSRTCGVVNATILPPPTGFDAGASLASVNVSALIEANDQSALLQAAQQVAQLAAVATGSGSASSVSELVANRSVALVKAILSTGALQDAQQAQQAISAIASLASSAASSLSDAAKDDLLSAAKLALQSLAASANSTSSSYGSDATATTNFLTELCRLLGIAMPSGSTASTTPTSSSRRRSLLQTSANSSAGDTATARLESLLSLSSDLSDALVRLAVPGGAYLAVGDGGVYVAAAEIAVPTASSDLTGATVSVDLEAGPQINTSSSNTRVTALLVLTGSALASAGGYGIDLQYAPSASYALSTALTATLPTGGTFLSGLVTVGWKAGSDAAEFPPILDGTSSYILLLIPASGYNSALQIPTACLQYDAVSSSINGVLAGRFLGTGTSYVSSSSYDSASGRIKCRLSGVGSFVVAQALESNRASSHLGVIVGAAVGGVVALLLLVCGIAALYVRRKHRRLHPSAKGEVPVVPTVLDSTCAIVK